MAEPGTAADAASPSERRRPFDRHRAALWRALTPTLESWGALGAYGRFEQSVSLILTGLVSLVVAVALLHLLARVALLVTFGLVDPADQAVFQAIFGMILTVLIAPEFNHSILSVLERKQSIVQVRTVVLIALLRRRARSNARPDQAGRLGTIRHRFRVRVRHRLATWLRASFSSCGPCSEKTVAPRDRATRC